MLDDAITHGRPGSGFSRTPIGLSKTNEKRKAMIIDHIYLPVSDLKRSSEFYKKILKPLGIDMPYEFDQLLGFAINTEPGFWLKNGEVGKTFTSHSPPRAQTLSGPATRRR